MNLKLFEVQHDDKTFGYVVGRGGVKKITKTGEKLTVDAENEGLEYKVHFKLDAYNMYTIG